MPIKDPFQTCAILVSLLREDKIFTNNTATSFTLTKQEGYMTFTERFKQNYGDEYSLDSNQALIATTAKTINLKKMISDLKSTD